MNENILLIVSSSAPNIFLAIDRLRTQVYSNPRIDLLCTLTDLSSYEGNSRIRQILIFPPRREWRSIYRLRRRIGREGYQVVAVLWDGQESRIRPKIFALACGFRRLLVFNEHLDCNYFRAPFLYHWLRARWKWPDWRGIRRHKFSVSPLFYFLKVLLRQLLFPVRLLVLLVLAGELGFRRWWGEKS